MSGMSELLVEISCLRSVDVRAPARRTTFSGGAAGLFSVWPCARSQRFSRCRSVRGTGCRIRSPECARAAEALAELLALFRRHLPPALHHAATPVGPGSPATSKAAEENLAEDQDADGLPERDPMPAEKRRHEPIPEAHDDEAE